MLELEAEFPRQPRYAEPVMPKEPWVSVEEVAEHLGVVRDSVYRWIEHRGLPAHKIGRLWKFKLSEVDDWVRAGGAATEEDKHGKEDVG